MILQEQKIEKPWNNADRVIIAGVSFFCSQAYLQGFLSKFRHFVRYTPFSSERSEEDLTFSTRLFLARFPLNNSTNTLE